MDALTDPTFWLALLTVVGVSAATVLVVVALRAAAFKAAHWLAEKIVAVAPAPYGGWIVGVVRFFYVAALFGGLTAFGVSLAIWRVPWPPKPGDHAFLNPLFWLTWLTVMAAIMLSGIVLGVMVRAAFARLWTAAADKRP